MIRISTSMIFNQGVTNMQARSVELAKTQNQLSNSRRILTPSDDPIASARSLEIEQSQSINLQYQRNTASASTSLSLSENTLTTATTLLQDVKTIAVNAGNGALSSNELKSIGSDLRARYQELIGLANATDGNGQYLFSGYQGSTKPFAETAPGTVAYFGDQGSRLTQITASRQIPVSDSGGDVFQLVKNGNKTFATAATGANTGTAVISPGEVIDPTKWNVAGNSKNFTVKFSVDTQVPPVTTYDIVDNVSGFSLLTGVAAAVTGPYLRTYTDAGNISLKTQAPPDTNATPFDYGAQLAVKGSPATGDTFTVKASTNVDVFATIYSLITAVETATDNPAGNAALANKLNSAMTDVDNSLDNVLRVRATIGSRLNEVDTATSSSQDLVVQYQSTLSGLRDLDYAKAISDLTQQQMVLQAAQQSFAKIQTLSLFNYLQL